MASLWTLQMAFSCDLPVEHGCIRDRGRCVYVFLRSLRVDKGRTDRSLPQIVEMVERSAGLPFGLVESLPSGGRLRLVF